MSQKPESVFKSTLCVFVPTQVNLTAIYTGHFEVILQILYKFIPKRDIVTYYKAVYIPIKNGKCFKKQYRY